MTYEKEIRDLLDTNQAKGLAQNLVDAIAIIARAREENEKIPLSLELEVVNLANYVIDYGAIPHQLLHLLDLWVKCSELNSFDPDEVDRVVRLASIISHLALYTLMNDAVQTTNTLSEQFGLLGVHDQDLSNLLRYIFDKNSKFLAIGGAPVWQSELILNQITLHSFLQEVGLEDEDLFSELSNYIRGDVIDLIKDKRVETSDKFRFTFLMIYGKHPVEERWLSNFDRLVNVEIP